MLFNGGFTSASLLNLLYSLPAILIALSFHEFSHAWVAWKMGDPTAKNAGRLSLDPVRHLDLVGFLFIIFFGFGWAKPVPINPRNFKKPKSGEILVSLAGVGMNFLVAFIAYGVSVVFFRDSVNSIAAIIVYYIIFFNIYFGIFNLIPIPPLDGFHIISTLFIRKAGKVVNFLYRYGYIILLVLILPSMFGFPSVIGILLNFVGGGILSAYSAFFSLFI